MCGISYSPHDFGSPMFGVPADLPSAKTRDSETRTAQYDQIEWKDRRDHRWRHRHRPRRCKTLHRGGRLRLHLRPPAGCARRGCGGAWIQCRSEEHTSELQSLMRISYAVFCLKKKNTIKYT